MNTRIIALVNQKGGVGKTTTAANLGACLASLKQKILLVDLDPQSNLSLHFGVKVHKIEKSINELLLDENIKFKDVVINTGIDNLELIPANIELSSTEMELVNVVGRERVLKDVLKDILRKNKYDFVIIDCSPSLGLLTLNALTTAKEVFIPLQAEYFALQGLGRLLKTIELVKKRVNPELELTGIITCMFDKRRNLSWEVLEKVRSFFRESVFKTIIRVNVNLAEAPSYGQSILTYAPGSHGAEDYLHLAKEVIKRGKRDLEKRKKASAEKLVKSDKIKFLNKKTRILVVDDDAGICDLLKDGFSEFTSNVYTANNFEQAVKHLKKGLLDILITDVSLPRKDGFGLAEWVKKQDYLIDLPIIMITGVKKDRNSVVRAMEIGVDKYVIKPFDLERLIIDVNNILNPAYKKSKLKKLIGRIKKIKGNYSKRERDILKVIKKKISELKSEK